MRAPSAPRDEPVPTDVPAAAGPEAGWHPAKPRLTWGRLLVAWIVAAASVYVAAGLVPGFSLDRPASAFVLAVVVAAFSAVLPALVAALRLPFTFVLGFVLVLIVDALAIILAVELLPSAGQVDSFADALLAALVMAATSIVLQVMLGTNDSDDYALRVVRRVARRQGTLALSDKPGIVFLEIDGLALPVLRRAMRDGNAPVMARWMEEDGYRLVEWETDLSSQTGASQAGILLGSNEDIPAFRWVEKERGTMMVCSSPEDCAKIERRHAGAGLLVDGGASRGNLLSGEAEETILTVSRMEAEKGANPGYRAFFADGVNVTRALVLFLWEVLLEWTAAIHAARRDVRPRGHRGGAYPFVRGTMCVLVRNAIVFGVLTDMMRGRPAVYATFSSYDEVAHHSGLERADTLAGAAQAGSAVRHDRERTPLRARDRTRSWCSRTTDRHRARRSSSATATASMSSSRGHLPEARWPASPVVTSSERWRGTPWMRRPAPSRPSAPRTTSPAARWWSWGRETSA